MGIHTGKPAEDSNSFPDDHFKKRIGKNEIDDEAIIIDMRHSTLGYIATLGWIGIDAVSGQKLRQPAIWLNPSREETEDYYISYEGYANYMDYQIAQTHLVVPRNGSVMKMKNNVRYFFNSHDSVSPNINYSLDSNNSSIIMNNISLYNKEHSAGLMLNLRASFDGLIDDELIGGNVNILCTVDEIV